MRSTSVLALVAAITFTGASAHVAVRAGRGFLSNGMQPEVVAKTLASVEEEWKAETALFVECSTKGLERDSIVDCEDAPKSFAKSCSKVLSAVVQGSSGDRDVAKEYMADVCEQPVLTDEYKNGCKNLAVELNKAMSADTYENRMNFDSSAICTHFWSHSVEAEKKRSEEEQARREEEEKKAAENAAEEEKKHREEEEAEAERKKKEEAARKAKEAKDAAAEAAARLAKKKAEAEAVEAVAKQKMEEAKALELEHEKLKAKVPTTAPAKEVAAKEQSTPAPTAKSTTSVQ